MFSELCSALYFSLAIVVFERNCRVPLPAASASGHGLFSLVVQFSRTVCARFFGRFVSISERTPLVKRFFEIFSLFFDAFFAPAIYGGGRGREAQDREKSLA